MPRIESMPNPFPRPSRAIYGFATYVVSYILFFVYVVWAYIPEEVLESAGLVYLPQKYWAIAIPTYFPFTIICGLMFVAGMNYRLVPDFSETRAFSDSYSIMLDDDVIVLDENDTMLPSVSDIPINIVNIHMFRNI